MEKPDFDSMSDQDISDWIFENEWVYAEQAHPETQKEFVGNGREFLIRFTKHILRGESPCATRERPNKSG